MNAFIVNETRIRLTLICTMQVNDKWHIGGSIYAKKRKFFKNESAKVIIVHRYLLELLLK